MKNNLGVNEPRLGWFEDGLPNDVTPQTATILIDDGEQIVLHVPWHSPEFGGFGQIERWFSAGAIYEDDPNGKIYTYSPPGEILFHDPFGSISLIGCTGVGFNSNPVRGIGKGKISVGAAILGARHFGYEKINGMRTEIKAISRWLDVSSVQKTYRRGEFGRMESVQVTGSKLEPIKIHKKMNLRVVPSWQSGGDGPGVTYVRDKIFLETRIKKPSDWRVHLELHGAFRDLVRISSWDPVGYDGIKVLRDADAEEGFDGGERIDRWCDLRSHTVVGYNSTPADNQRSWFTFRDVQSRGFARWEKIRVDYARGINPIMATLESDDWPIETKFVNAMIGLEAIAFTAIMESGAPKKDVANIAIGTRLQHLSEKLYVNFLPDDWHRECAYVYNGIKHANRQYPEFDPIITNYYRAILLFRVWVCQRLGIPRARIWSRLEYDPMMMHLETQNAVNPVNDW